MTNNRKIELLEKLVELYKHTPNRLEKRQIWRNEVTRLESELASLKDEGEKYYFEDTDSEVCYTKDYFMEKYDEDEITVYEAIPDRIKGIFWCKEEQFCGDDSRDSCGKQCRAYKPRNGKSGCCKHYTTKMYIHGEKITLTK